MWKYKGISYTWGPPSPDLLKDGIVLCPKCKKSEATLDKMYGVMPCEDCKARSEGYTDRKRTQHTPEYIKRQQEKYHDDFVQPHIVENGKVKVNPEFVKLYPDKAHMYYTHEEMKRAGMPKLIDYSKKVKANEKAQKERIDEFKSKMIEYKQTGDPTKVEDFLRKL
jgi:hypothetical protein